MAAVSVAPMIGYLDCTLNEIIAAAVGIGVPVPNWIFPELRFDDSERAERVRSGKNALIERGLARVNDERPELDPNFAAAITVAGTPLLIIGVVHAREVPEASWLLARPDLATIATRASDDRYRLRTIATPDVLAAVCTLAELRDDAEAIDIDIAIETDAVGGAPIVQRDGGPDEQAIGLARLRSEFERPVSLSSIEVAFVNDPQSTERGGLAWIADEQGNLATVETLGSAVRVRGLAGADLIESIRRLLPSPTS